MCTLDFYEGQGRLDGAFCDYTENDKMEYLSRIASGGVVNIEMEATCFAALTHHAGIKAAIVCVALLNRMKGDQVSTPKEVQNEWINRPQKLVGKYIKRCLQLKDRYSFDSYGTETIVSPRRLRLVQQESQTFE